MKPRHTPYDNEVCEKITRKLGLGDQLNAEWRQFFADETSPPFEITKTPFTHVKLHRRGENCEIPDGCDYFLVVSHEMDCDGEWLPTEVRAVQSVRELKEILRKMAASSDSVVVKASAWFEHVAAGLGLHHLTSEWGKI